MTCPAASGRPCNESAQSASVALIHSQKGGPKQQLWEDERAGAHRTLGMEQHDGPGARNVIHETKGTQEGESGGGRACSPPASSSSNSWGLISTINPMLLDLALVGFSFLQPKSP